MYLVKSQFSMFKDIVNSDFNDGGSCGGHDERVHLLERLMYVTGMLRGHLEMVLEQHSHWKAMLAGEQPPHLVRSLDFNQKIDPAPRFQSGLQRRGGLQFESVPSGSSSAQQPPKAKSPTLLADSPHEESSSSQETFKGTLPFCI